MNFVREIHWRPVIGDPSPMGWLTVAAYAVVAVACWFAAVRNGRAPGTAPGGRGLWTLVALFMAFLCINKQLDLQSLVTDIGRVLSWRQGWYAERREFQKLFIVGLLASALLTSVFIAIRWRSFWRRHVLLAAGLVFLSCFIAVRAVSFHHMDAWLGSTISGLRMNWILELSGIAMIGLAAVADYIAPTGFRRKRLRAGP